MINRYITNELIRLLSYFPVVGITGSRQVGKTTLTRLLKKSINKDVVFLDLEKPDDLSKISDPTLYFRKYEDKCIVLDEIQRAPHLFPVMRSLIDKKRVPARFIITGSASPNLIKDSSESLAGRIAYKELAPFCISEINNKFDIEEHWLRGGYPLSLFARSSALSKTWIDNYIQTYIERDLPLLGLQVPHLLLWNLWSMISHIHGSILNMSYLSKSLEITSPTLKKYLYFLSDAYLVRILQPYYQNITKRVSKSPKIYFRDSGILHTVLGINSMEQLFGHPVKGHSWEGYIIEQIYAHCNNDFGFYYYRTHHGAECDLVLTKANKPIAAIEIKFTASPTPNKGLINSIEDLSANNNFIICQANENYPIAENIIVCNLSSFLNNYLPKLRN